MIGTSTPEWIFIRLSILVLRFYPILCLTGLLTHHLVSYNRRHDKNNTENDESGAFRPIWLLHLFLVAEATFYIFLWRPYRDRVNTKAVHPPPLSREERRALFERCISTIPSAESYLRGWFHNAELEDIRRDNLREFLMWAFFDQDSGARSRSGFDDDGAVRVDESVQDEVSGYITRVEALLGRPLKDGRGTAQSLRLTFDEMKTEYRGLVWYMIVFIVDQFTHLVMSLQGFQYYPRPGDQGFRTFPPRPQEWWWRLGQRRLPSSPAPDLGYWYRPHTTSEKRKVSIVFLHGIGIGLLSYIRFLVRIQAGKDDGGGGGGVGVIAVEILPVSFRLTASILDRAEFVRQMTLIVNHHGWHHFATISHSYGSVLTTHLLSSHELQRRIVSTVLIDPVSIMLHLPQVAYNFTRRRPRGANEWQLWYFASTDPGVAHCLGRHFFWNQNVIWKEELQFFGNRQDNDGARRDRRKVGIALAGKDLIVDTAAVAQYLGDRERHEEGGSESSAAMEVVLFPDLDHAQIFDDPKGLDRLIALVSSCCES